MRGFAIILVVTLFVLWVYLCIRYGKSATLFIQKTFNKFIGRNDIQDDIR